MKVLKEIHNSILILRIPVILNEVKNPAFFKLLDN